MQGHILSLHVDMAFGRMLFNPAQPPWSTASRRVDSYREEPSEPGKYKAGNEVREKSCPQVSALSLPR
jgi:hypothetical protein